MGVYYGGGGVNEPKDLKTVGYASVLEVKTQVMGQGVDSPPSITISTQELEVVHDSVYLGSTISDTLSLDVKLDKCIGKQLPCSLDSQRVYGLIRS